MKITNNIFFDHLCPIASSPVYDIGEYKKFLYYDPSTGLISKGFSDTVHLYWSPPLSYKKASKIVQAFTKTNSRLVVCAWHEFGPNNIKIAVFALEFYFEDYSKDERPNWYKVGCKQICIED